MRTPAAGNLFDLRQRQPIDVDQLRGRLDAHLHEVDQVGAAAEKFGVRLRGDALIACCGIRGA